MFTVVETDLFQKQWALYWSEDERVSSRRTSPSIRMPVT
jgi:hypothetical protein